MVACDREMLKILVKTPVSWSALDWSTSPYTPSGPAVFLGFTDLGTHLTSCSCSVTVWVLDAGGVRHRPINLKPGKEAVQPLSK